MVAEIGLVKNPLQQEDRYTNHRVVLEAMLLSSPNAWSLLQLCAAGRLLSCVGYLQT